MNRTARHYSLSDNTCIKLALHVLGTICHTKGMNFEEGNVHYMMCNESGIRETLHCVCVFRFYAIFSPPGIMLMRTIRIKTDKILGRGGTGRR